MYTILMPPEMWSVFLSFQTIFSPFPCPPPPLQPRRNWKNKKTPSRYYHFTHVYHKWNSYHVYMVPEIWSTKDRFFVILGHSLAFYPTNIQKNQNFEKIKKTSGDIIILHLCTTNDDHMMYGSGDMECNRIISHFGPFFALSPH